MLEANEALCRRCHDDLFVQGNLDAAKEIFTPDFVCHSPGLPPEMSQGPEGMQKFAAMIRCGFSNIRITVEDSISQNDKVVHYWTFEGTHSADFMGRPATGKNVSVKGVDIFRVANGKMAEMWQVWDQMGMVRQLSE
jgi:steroid delta-isomerase-like uncharacterized protein